MLDKSYFCMSRKRLNKTLHYNLTPTFAMSENLLNSVLPSNKKIIIYLRMSLSFRTISYQSNIYYFVF